jgi:hypothetical protein
MNASYRTRAARSVIQRRSHCGSHNLPVSRAIVLAIGLAAFTAPAAAQITVNTTAPSIAADGVCSIVEAVANANVAGAAHTDCAPGDRIATTIALRLER